jgi:hypothetical protein
MEAVLLTSAIAHALNRKASATGLCFTPQELEGWMGALVDNRDAIITLAIQADGRVGPGETTFAARMRAAIPERFGKRNKYKNLLAKDLPRFIPCIQPSRELLRNYLPHNPTMGKRYPL